MMNHVAVAVTQIINRYCPVPFAVHLVYLVAPEYADMDPGKVPTKLSATSRPSAITILSCPSCTPAENVPVRAVIAVGGSL